ncbi:MAG: O-antigen ligase family protein [Bacteroidia bacterium]|nr:O-antigen ligase family protein [Bacteroidia bacterium]
MQARSFYLRWGGLFCIACGLSWSHSLISVGVGALGLGYILSWGSRPLLKAVERPILFLTLPFILLYLLHALSWFYTEDTGQWWVEMRVKAPLLFLLPASVMAWRESPVSIRKGIHSIFHLSLLIVGIGTLFRFWTDPTAALETIRHGRYVPMMGGISHIYYAGLVGIAFFFLWTLPFWGGENLKWVIAGIYFAILHILALRTGLVALYGTAFFLLLRWGVKKPRRWPWIILFIGLGMGFVHLLICHLPPLRQRWENFRTDLAQYKPGRYITHTSVTRRLAALEASWRVFREHPWIGVGIADNEVAVFQEIPRLPYRWDKEGYILPHNQFVEYAVGLGAIGVGVFLLFWIGAFRQHLGGQWVGWLFYWLLLLQGEAFLERQVGLTAFLWGTALMWVELNARKS